MIDRFEGRYAVVEMAGSMHNVPKEELPPGVKEGDVLCFKDGRWTMLPGVTAEEKRKIDKLAQDLWGD
ncbi:MAG: DUF3006 domain-containing protein [Deltaproteobacteria bacterium]